MNNTDQIPSFDSLLAKEPKEVVQAINEHGFKLPKDDYYAKSLIGEYGISCINIIFVIGKKYVIRFKENSSLIVFPIKKEDINCILENIKGRNKILSEYSNPVGPAVFWVSRQSKHYFINGEQLTKAQFTSNLVKQRICKL